MTNSQCINGTLDGANYSSPVPIIGLYVAAGTLVCMLMMIYDIVSGIRSQKRWLPCKAFTLNSVTLTLLSIATKIQVDLTTSMPSPMDQLSKLSGSTLVCISLGFLYPSLGVFSQSESFSNMAAMTIFVLTIFVNICIQLYTGVIVLFFVEHIIILWCMIMVLLVSWYSYWYINAIKMWESNILGTFTVPEKHKSLLGWLKSSYDSSVNFDPEVLACREQACVLNGIICPLSSVILIQAAFRSLVLKQLEFCSGISDYNWSISVIVITQIVTVAVGTFAICFRFLAFFNCIIFPETADSILGQAYPMIKKSPILGIRSKLYRCSMFLKRVLLNTIWNLICFTLYLPKKIILSLVGNDGWEEWKIRKTEEDYQIWKDAAKGDNHLVKLLSKTYPCLQVPMERCDEARDYRFLRFSKKFYSGPDRKLYDEFNSRRSRIVGVNSLSIVVLVRIAQVSLPDNLSRDMVKTYNEVNEFLHYIDRQTRTRNRNIKDMLVFAKAVWEGEKFSCLLPKMTDFNPDPKHAIEIIRKLGPILLDDHVRKGFIHIAHFIIHQSYSSIEELGTVIEHMFVGMLRVMLEQLPTAILNSLNDCPAEEYGRRVKVAIKIIYKVMPVQNLIQWQPSDGHPYLGFINDCTRQESDLLKNDDVIADAEKLSNNFPKTGEQNDGGKIIKVRDDDPFEKEKISIQVDDSGCSDSVLHTFQVA